MNQKRRIHNLLQVVSFVLLSAVFSAPYAQESKQKQTSVVEKPKAESKSAESTSVPSRLLRLDADLDNDGIIDAVTSLSAVKSAQPMETKSHGDSTLQRDISAGFRKAQVERKQNRRNTCMDYMMLSTEEKQNVDLRIQQRTLGAFGSRPCDPYVSDMIERPFDNEYIEIPLFPSASIRGVVVK